MKKILLTLVLATTLFSCTQDEIKCNLTAINGTQTKTFIGDVGNFYGLMVINETTQDKMWVLINEDTYIESKKDGFNLCDYDYTIIRYKFN